MNQKHIQHLYLRAGFGLGYNQLKNLTSKSKQEIIANLFIEVETDLPLELDLLELEVLLDSKTMNNQIIHLGSN